MGGRSSRTGKGFSAITSPPVMGLLFGAIWGAAYVLAELPNSYIKRRLNIPPGQNIKGWKGILFIIIDQVDSVIGCVIVIPVFYDISAIDAFAFLFIGGSVHFVVNVALYYAGLKKQRA